MSKVSSDDNSGAGKGDGPNPLLIASDTPFGVPPFDQIETKHFEPAYEEGMRRHEMEIAGIVSNCEVASFENTVEALENSGQLLDSVATIFSNLNAAHTNAEMLALARIMAPKLTAHYDNIALQEELFARVRTVWNARETLGLDVEREKLLEDTYQWFVRNGAELTDGDKETLRAINEELAVLTTRFGQNLLAETNAYELVIGDSRDLAGLPEGIMRAAAVTAREKGREGQWIFTLSNPSVMAFLHYAENRELRRQIWEAYQSRCDHGNAEDNSQAVIQIANLRRARAQLLGYESHAHYVLEEAMAESPDRVYKMLRDLWNPALAKAQREAEDIRREIADDGNSFELKPYDWRFYTEKIRRKRYALEAEELRPYFRLENVLAGAFAVAHRLYGLSFQERRDLPVYHPEVSVYEVRDDGGPVLGVLYTDFFPRASKRVGAWMTSYRRQSIDAAGNRVLPVISIVGNFTKSLEGKPALLTLEEVGTLFHEFGHALHGLLSQVRYRSLSGTAVSRDFVELPSQVLENWAMHPEVLKEYARHYESGECIPEELLAKIAAVETFNQGFGTTEYLAASFLDMDYHTQTEAIGKSAREFEQGSMEKIGLPDEIIPRYRSSYFQHIFSGGYSSGYYSYIWAAVLDQDAFAAFEEAGLYDRSTADAFREHILERGGTEKPSTLYRRFRGSDPDPKHLMKRRGLE